MTLYKLKHPAEVKGGGTLQQLELNMLLANLRAYLDVIHQSTLQLTPQPQTWNEAHKALYEAFKNQQNLNLQIDFGGKLFHFGAGNVAVADTITPFFIQSNEGALGDSVNMETEDSQLITAPTVLSPDQVKQLYTSDVNSQDADIVDETQSFTGAETNAAYQRHLEESHGVVIERAVVGNPVEQDLEKMYRDMFMQHIKEQCMIHGLDFNGYVGACKDNEELTKLPGLDFHIDSQNEKKATEIVSKLALRYLSNSSIDGVPIQRETLGATSQTASTSERLSATAITQPVASQTMSMGAAQSQESRSKDQVSQVVARQAEKHIAEQKIREIRDLKEKISQLENSLSDKEASEDADAKLIKILHKEIKSQAQALSDAEQANRAQTEGLELSLSKAQADADAQRQLAERLGSESKDYQDRLERSEEKQALQIETIQMQSATIQMQQEEIESQARELGEAREENRAQTEAVTTLESRVDEISGEKKELEAQLLTLQKQVRTSEMELKIYKGERVEDKNTIADLGKRLERSQKSQQDTASANDGLRIQLSTEMKSSESLKGQLSDLRSEIDLLNQQIQVSQGDQRAMASLQLSLGESERQSQAKSKTIAALQQQIDQLRASSSRQQRAYQQQLKKAQALTGEQSGKIQVLETRNAALRGELRTKDRKIGELEQSKAESRKSLISLQTQVGKYKEQEQQFKSRIQNLSEELSDAKSRLSQTAQLERLLERQENQIAGLEDQLVQAEAEKQKFLYKAKEAATRLVAVTQNNTDLDQTIDQLKSQNAHLNKRVETLAETAQSLNEAESSLTFENAELRSQLAQQTEQVNKLRGALKQEKDDPKVERTVAELRAFIAGTHGHEVLAGLEEQQAQPEINVKQKKTKLRDTWQQRGRNKSSKNSEGRPRRHAPSPSSATRRPPWKV